MKRSCLHIGIVVLMAVAMLVIAVPSADATPYLVQYYAMYPPMGSEQTFVAAQFNDQTITFPKWNPADFDPTATLTKATFSLAGLIMGTMSLTNSGETQVVGVNETVTTHFWMKNEKGVTITNAYPSYCSSTNGWYDPGGDLSECNVTLNAGESLTIPNPNPPYYLENFTAYAEGLPSSTTASDSLAWYTKQPLDTSTTYDFTVFASTGFQVNGGGGKAQGGQETMAQVMASVTYEFDIPSEIPEPGTMFLLGSALLCLGIWGRKKTA